MKPQAFVVSVPISHLLGSTGLHSHIPAKKVDTVHEKGKYLLCWLVWGFGVVLVSLGLLFFIFFLFGFCCCCCWFFICIFLSC